MGNVNKQRRNFISLSELWRVPWNWTSGGFAYICQGKWVGIIAIKTERTQIQFLSDVLVAVTLLDLKVPTILKRPVHTNPKSGYFWNRIYIYFSLESAFRLLKIKLCKNPGTEKKTKGKSEQIKEGKIDCACPNFESVIWILASGSSKLQSKQSVPIEW